MRSSLVLLPALLTACELPKDTCDSGSTGSLAIALADTAAAGAAPTVRIYGPDGALVQEVTPPAVLEGLPGGAYTYEVIRVWDGGTATGTLDLGVGEVCVGGEEAAIELDAQAQPGSGQLWATSWESVLVLPATPDAATLTPEASRSVPLTNNFNALTADASGNLWGATPWTYGARFVVLAPGALTGTAEATTDLELTAPSLSYNANFTSLSFDAEGNAWATTGAQMGGFVGVVGWSAETLRAARRTGGPIEAEPDWAVQVEGLADLSGGTTDATGDLWVTSSDDEALVRLAAADLRTGTAGVDAAPTIAPAVRMRPVQSTTGAPAWRGLTSVVPSSTGGLYVLSTTNGSVLFLPPESLSASGDTTVDALDLGVTALPQTLSPDAEGGVWFIDTGRVGHLTAGDAAAATPEVAAIERAGALFLDVAR